jgi:hypothetical protein
MVNNKRYALPGHVRMSFVAVLCMTLLAMSSCGVPAQQPSLVIKAPQSGVSAGDVTISVDVSNFTLLDRATGPNAISQGHIIYYLDTAVPTYYAHSAFSKAGTFALSSERSFTWSNIPPGQHTFSAQLVNHDSTPLPAPVVASVTIDVAAPQGNPEIVFLTPVDAASLGPGNIVVELKVNNFIINSQSAGVANRPGEGHLIYYLDETPPTDQGKPAVTDLSIVSANLRHLWKSVNIGKHTLSVQLVNNDDTPLAVPVVVTISITVASGG